MMQAQSFNMWSTCFMRVYHQVQVYPFVRALGDEFVRVMKMHLRLQVVFLRSLLSLLPYSNISKCDKTSTSRTRHEKTLDVPKKMPFSNRNCYDSSLLSVIEKGGPFLTKLECNFKKHHRSHYAFPAPRIEVPINKF